MLEDSEPCFDAGTYLVDICDHYIYNLILLLVTALESFAIAWAGWSWHEIAKRHGRTHARPTCAVGLSSVTVAEV